MVFPGGKLRGKPVARPPAGAHVLWREVPGAGGGGGNPATGKVEAWLLPAEGAHAGPRPLVVFSHGNGELIDDWPEMLAPYRAMGMHVLLPEYRSYGRSTGVPSEDAVAGDLLWFMEAAKSLLAASAAPVDASRIVLHGRSLGGGIVGRALEDFAPRALILQSTFTSIPDVAKRWLVPRAFIENQFRTIDRLPKYDGPTLVLHGTEDLLIPATHGRALYAAAKHGSLRLFPGHHNTLPMHPTEYWPAILGTVT
jgi:fermentation-respiration switch protein FrsA (DUF1100 family)